MGTLRETCTVAQILKTLLPESHRVQVLLGAHLNNSFPLKFEELVLGCGASLHRLYSFQTAMILSLSNVPGGFRENRKLPNRLSNRV